jgi:hypothetical protein
MLFKTISYLLILLIIVVTAAVIFRAFQFELEGFDASMTAYKSSSSYQTQLKLVNELSDTRYNGRRDFNNMLGAQTDLVPEEYCFVNFHSLGCRFTGYLGPIGPNPPGYFDSNASVLAALRMGCRTLILEIDYYSDNCSTIFPRLAVRDKQNANLSDPSSDIECQSIEQSNIYDTCSAIARYAFSNSVPNPADPLIVVLYLLRLPPNKGLSDYNTILLTYYRNIALGISPLSSSAVNILAAGGNYSRQAQESALLLSNPISLYSGKTLIFCNADTSIFRTQSGIPTNEDLDYMINLRLTYNQKQFGVTMNTTTNTNGNKYGILDSVDQYMTITPDRLAGIQGSTKSVWTLLFDNDPKLIVPQKSADQVMENIGVHCVPIQLWSTGGDASYDYMFDKEHFGVWSFIPKPKHLRYTIPSTAMPGEAPPQNNSNGGKLSQPKL